MLFGMRSFDIIDQKKEYAEIITVSFCRSVGMVDKSVSKTDEGNLVRVRLSPAAQFF